MFAHPNAGMHVDETDFSLDIEQLVINGDQAKVIAERNYDVVHGDSKGQVQCGGPEAYLLKKVDGDWKMGLSSKLCKFFCRCLFHKSFPVAHV